MNEPSLFDAPVARARSADPDTSHAAAASLTSDAIRRSQQAVLRVLRDRGPMTDTSLVNEYEVQAWKGAAPKQSPSGIRTRRKELVEMGFVQAAGKKELLDSGRYAHTWEAV